MVSKLKRLLELVSTRYGLKPRNSWATDLERPFKSMSQTSGLAREELLTLAFEDDILMREIAGHLTVEESFFFRHPDHFEALTDHNRRSLDRCPKKERLTIWSAGCANGQEPYSIAIALKEQFSNKDCSRVTIIASDLNPAAIEEARQGIYSEWSFRGISTKCKTRFFEPHSNNRFRLNDDIRSMVDFRCLSIQEHAKKFPSSSIDCIFFRNVSIYLHAQAQSEIYGSFSSLLRKGGLLFLAPSDVLPDRNMFVSPKAKAASVLTNAKEIPDPPLGCDYKASKHALESAPYTPKASSLREESDSILPLIHNEKGICTKCSLGNERAEQALFFANQGAYKKATIAADSLIETDPEGKLGYLIRGQISLANDALDDALVDFRRAVFIDPDDPLTRFLYASTLQMTGAVRRSLMQTNNLLSRLSTMKLEAPLDDGHTTAGELLRATRQLRERLT